MITDIRKNVSPIKTQPAEAVPPPPLKQAHSPPNWRWPDFTLEEMACRCCGESFHWPEFMDRLQFARTRVGKPFRINSAHRCRLHNARIRGAPKSQHLRLAADVSLRGHDKHALYRAFRDAGFSGFGF